MSLANDQVPGLVAFLGGAEIAYAGLDGRPYRATWRGEARRIEVTAADGTVLMAAEIGEAQAVWFWLTVHDRPSPAQPQVVSEPEASLVAIRAAQAVPAQRGDMQGSLF